MARDGFDWLVNVIEEEDTFPEFEVWLIVPGGILFGTLVSEKKFCEYSRESTSERSMSMEEGMQKAGLKLHTAEMLDKYAALLPDGHTEACLVDVQIFSVGVALRPKMVRVRIDDVSAWGFGAIPEGVMRPTQAA